LFPVKSSSQHNYPQKVAAAEIIARHIVAGRLRWPSKAGNGHAKGFSR